MVSSSVVIASGAHRIRRHARPWRRVAHKLYAASSRGHPWHSLLRRVISRPHEIRRIPVCSTSPSHWPKSRRHHDAIPLAGPLDGRPASRPEHRCAAAGLRGHALRRADRRAKHLRGPAIGRRAQPRRAGPAIPAQCRPRRTVVDPELPAVHGGRDAGRQYVQRTGRRPRRRGELPAAAVARELHVAVRRAGRGHRQPGQSAARAGADRRDPAGGQHQGAGDDERAGRPGALGARSSASARSCRRSRLSSC